MDSQDGWQLELIQFVKRRLGPERFRIPLKEAHL